MWAEALLSGGPHRSAQGKNQKWPKSGPDGYIIPAWVDKEAIQGSTWPPMENMGSCNP